MALLTALLELENHAAMPILLTDPTDLIPRMAPINSGSSTGIAIGNSVMRSVALGDYSIMRWVMDTTSRAYNVRRNLKLYIFDQANRTGSVIEMSDCLLAEVMFPALDRKSNADATLRLTVKAERLRTTSLGPNDAQRFRTSTLKHRKVSDFEFVVDGLDGAPTAVQTVSPLIVKQLVGAVSSGRERFLGIEGTKIEESNIVVTLPRESGAGFLEWYESATTPTNRDRHEKTATLRYLTGGREILVSASFYGLAILRVSEMGRLLRAEMSYDRIEFDRPSLT